MLYRMNYLTISLVIIQMKFTSSDSTQRISIKHTSPVGVFELSQDESNSVVSSYSEAFTLCSNNFKMERWNCPIPKKIRKTKKPISLTRFYPTACKETSYVYSLVAASVAFNFIRACQMGRGANCPCGHQDDFTPGVAPCEKNIKHGFKRAKSLMKYLDYKPIQAKARKEFNFRNILAGFQALKDDLKWACRCHGVSGNCAIRKCWKTTPVSLKATSTKLKKLYNKAKKLFPKNEKNEKSNSQKEQNNVQKRHPKGAFRTAMKTTNITNLVYLDESPDYCKPNLELGIKGTLNRQCNHYNDVTCQNLCNKCGYRKHSYVEKVLNSQCNCKFHWCCRVTCETCVENRIYAKCVL